MLCTDAFVDNTYAGIDFSFLLFDLAMVYSIHFFWGRMCNYLIRCIYWCAWKRGDRGDTGRRVQRLWYLGVLIVV